MVVSTGQDKFVSGYASGQKYGIVEARKQGKYRGDPQ